MASLIQRPHVAWWPETCRPWPPSLPIVCTTLSSVQRSCYLKRHLGILRPRSTSACALPVLWWYVEILKATGSRYSAGTLTLDPLLLQGDRAWLHGRQPDQWLHPRQDGLLPDAGKDLTATRWRVFSKLFNLITWVQSPNTTGITGSPQASLRFKGAQQLGFCIGGLTNAGRHVP